MHNEMVAKAAISRPKTWAHAHAALHEGATTVTTKSTKAAKTTKPTKKSAVKKPVAKKVVTKKAPAKKAPAKKVVTKKAPAKKVVTKKAPAKKAPATNAAPKKVVAQKSAAKKAAPAKAASKKAAALESNAEVVAEVVEAPPAPVIKKFGNVVEMPKKKVKAVPGITKVISPGPQIGPKVLVVREDESPWTKAELKQIRVALHQDESRLLEEIDTAEIGLADLIRDSGDGAGDDQADAGSKTFEREHEMSLANNAREMLLQVRHALGRIDDGSYGVCEGCGNAVGKLRLQAFPRATLCMACKVAEERY